MGRPWPVVILIAVFLAAGGLVLFQATKTSQPKEPPVATPAVVPWPTPESVVRTFLELINEHRIPEAVSMIDQSAAADDTAKQTWGVQFANFDSLTLVSIDRISDDSAQSTFKVVVEAKLKSEGFWNNGQNTRWIQVLKKDNHLLKIAGIATGP